MQELWWIGLFVVILNLSSVCFLFFFFLYQCQAWATSLKGREEACSCDCSMSGSACAASYSACGLRGVDPCRTQETTKGIYFLQFWSLCHYGGKLKPRLSGSSTLWRLPWLLKLSASKLYPSLCKAVTCLDACPVVWFWRVFLVFCKSLLLKCLKDCLNAGLTSAL